MGYWSSYFSDLINFEQVPKGKGSSCCTWYLFSVWFLSWAFEWPRHFTCFSRCRCITVVEKVRVPFKSPQKGCLASNLRQVQQVRASLRTCLQECSKDSLQLVLSHFRKVLSLWPFEVVQRGDSVFDINWTSGSRLCKGCPRGGQLCAVSQETWRGENHFEGHC